MHLQPVIVPYRYDERETGPGLGPRSLLDRGLIARLAVEGREIAAPIEAHLPKDERGDGPVAINIGKLGARTAALVAAARRRGAGALVLAGDCTAAVGIVAGLQLADGASAPIGIVWLDAHGDFNTPETSFSGILAGMPVAILAGLAGPLWREAAGLAAPISTARIVLAGVRDLDEKEAALLRSTDVSVISTGEVRDGRPLEAAVHRLAAVCSVIYLHVDLDVLDPRLVPSSSTPAANGLEIAEAASAAGVALATGKIAAVGLAGLNPGAGARGDRSVKSALALLEQALAAWVRVPGPPTANDG
jgi:arginase